MRKYHSKFGQISRNRRTRPIFEKDSCFDLGVGPTVTYTSPLSKQQGSMGQVISRMKEERGKHCGLRQTQLAERPGRGRDALTADRASRRRSNAPLQRAIGRVGTFCTTVSQQQHMPVMRLYSHIFLYALRSSFWIMCMNILEYYLKFGGSLPT